MLRGIGRLRAGGGASAAFTPASLFTGGAQGAWYDPSDLSSMWQDSAGTTAAAVNSPVGKILDKSGNANHAIQATSTARPILRQSGALYWLEFDGVDDMLQSSVIASIAQPVSEAVRVSGAPAMNYLISGHAGGEASLYRPSAGMVELYAGAESGGQALPSPASVIGVFNGSASTLAINGVESTSLNPSTAGLTGFTVGAGGNGASTGASQIGQALWLARALTTGEKAQLKTYLDTK